MFKIPLSGAWSRPDQGANELAMLFERILQGTESTALPLVLSRPEVQIDPWRTELGEVLDQRADVGLHFVRDFVSFGANHSPLFDCMNVGSRSR